jgi:hypothetical protein
MILVIFLFLAWNLELILLGIVSNHYLLLLPDFRDRGPLHLVSTSQNCRLTWRPLYVRVILLTLSQRVALQTLAQRVSLLTLAQRVVQRLLSSRPCRPRHRLLQDFLRPRFLLLEPQHRRQDRVWRLPRFLRQILQA